MERRERVLVVGRGAREHALASMLSREGYDVLVAPGNPGMARFATCVPVDPDDLDALVSLAVTRDISLVVVGPELPLTEGLVDRLAAAGVLAFGPSRLAARLEGSKAWMKTRLSEWNIATAPFRIFDSADAADAFVRAANRPLVVKADGLAAGKGVVVAKDADEACEAIHRFMRERTLGRAGDTVVIEEVLSGEEASFHVLCDGERAVPLVPAQDHKRVDDGDTGPNTGGMGAYAPAPCVTDAMVASLMQDVVEPTLRGMKAEGCPFRGVLFVGLMIDNGRASVLEFNVRFGDPEACVILPSLEGELGSLLRACAEGRLTQVTPVRPTRHALGVVLASEGYPGPYESGLPIAGLDLAESVDGVTVYHAGTRQEADGQVVTHGGRVLCVVGTGASLGDAARTAYEGVSHIRWRGEHHRSDIGFRALAGQSGG